MIQLSLSYRHGSRPSRWQVTGLNWWWQRSDILGFNDPGRPQSKMYFIGSKNGNKIRLNYGAIQAIHLNQSWHSPVVHICVTGPQRVKISSPVEQMLNWAHNYRFIVRRAGLLWSQQDFEWRWSVPLFKCLTVLEFSFILFDLCLLITFFNFIMNYVPIITFWIFTYHKIWILSIMSCFIWSYWIIYFLACLEVSWRVVS